MARTVALAILLAVCVNYASCEWSSWTKVGECRCDGGPGGTNGTGGSPPPPGTGSQVMESVCVGTACGANTRQYAEIPCDCGILLSIGEIAGIAVGAGVFVVLIIILIVACCCCGMDECCMDCCTGMNSWDSEENLHQAKRGPMMVQARPQMVQAQPQMVQVQQPQMVQVQQPQMQVMQPQVSFASAVVPGNQIQYQRQVQQPSFVQYR